MKPIIIIADGDKIALTKEQLEQYLSEAYEEGRRDGVASVPSAPITIPNPPYNPYQPYVTWTASATA